MAENTLRERLDTSETANSNRVPGVSEGTFLQKFWKEYIEQGKLAGNEKNELIEEIMTKDSLAGTKAKTALEKFRASDDIYVHINLEKIDIFMLQKQVAKSYLILQKSRQRFETAVLKDYDLDAKVFEAKISKELKWKSENEIAQILKYESRMQEFLKKTLGNIPARREKFSAFAGLSESVIEKRIAKMSASEKKGVHQVLYKIKNGNVPNDFDIRTLLASPLLDAKEKIDFVHIFIPFIQLAKAVEIWLISENDADKKRKAFVDNILKNVQLSDENKNLLRVQITNSDIELPTRDLVKDEIQAMEVSDKIGFEAFEKEASGAYQSELERIKANGPASFEDLKRLLAEMNRDARFENIGILWEEKIVKISKKSTSGEDESYIEIIKIDDREKKFSFRMVGSESINLESPGEVKDVEYAVFFNNLKNSGQTRLSVFSRDVIEQKMQSGEIPSNELQLKKDATSFEGETWTALRAEMKASKISSIEKEILDLSAKIGSDEYASQKSENEAEKAKLEREKKLLQNTEFSPEDAKEEYNKQEFLKKLNEIDPTGSSLWFWPGVAFTYIDDKGVRWVYTIRKFDRNKISVNDRKNYYKDISLSDFFSAFKNWKAKRVASIGTEEKLVKHFGDNFELKNGEIVQKDAELNGVKKPETVEYLTNGKGKLIKVISLGNGMVEFQEGKIEKDNWHDDHGHGKTNHGHHHGPKEEKYILKLTGALVQKWTLDEFYQYINSEKKEEAFSADWKTGQNYTEHPLEVQNKTHGSFVDRFFKGMSLYEIIHGGEMVFEGIKETLEHGSHAKSAHAALAMAKWLPESLRDEMYMKVEAAEAEETENAKKKLGSIDSWMAVERIEKWLLNRDTPQYKLEAGALFMMEKYGHLTAKKSWKDDNGVFHKGLYQYRGKFLWYERLGWRIWDELYNEVMNEMQWDNQSFVEERLVHRLLKKQCNSEAHHYSGIHRRSRVHKEFENAWKSGVDAEFEKGEKDAWAYRGSRKMVEEGMGEAKWGTSSNAFWWALKAAKKGTGEPADYMHIPSAFLLSWACFDMDQTTYSRVKNYWDSEGIPVIAFRMFGNNWLMNLYRDTIRELAKEIQAAGYSGCSDIISETEEIYITWKDRTWKEEDRLNAASKYWDKYGEILTRALTFSLEKDTKYSQTDTIIRRKRNENPVFWKYYELVRGATSEDKAFNQDLVDDWVGNTGFFGMNPHDLILKYMKLGNDGWFYFKETWPKIWHKLADDISATKDKILVAGESLNSSVNRIAQKEYIAELLEEITGTFYEMNGQRSGYTFDLNKNTSYISSDLNKWGLNFQDLLGEVSPRDILDGKYRSKFQQVADNIISGRSWENSGVNYDIPDILKKTQAWAYQATTQNPANSNNPFLN